MEQQSLRVIDENVDLMKVGVPFTAAKSGPSHPVEKLEISYPRISGAFKEHTISNVYGSGMFVQMRMEQEILSQPLRLPGLPNSFAGLETMLGKDEEFEFSDFMNLPENSGKTFNLHETMESRLGMGINKLH